MSLELQNITSHSYIGGVPFARFQIPKAVMLKIQIFSDVLQCRLVKRYDVSKDFGAFIFRSTQSRKSHCLTRKMVVIRPFETSVNIYQSIGRNLPEDFHLHCVYRDSSGGIATRKRLGGPGIESMWGRDIPHPSGPALGSNQPPVQRIPGLFPGGKATGSWR